MRQEIGKLLEILESNPKRRSKMKIILTEDQTKKLISNLKNERETTKNKTKNKTSQIHQINDAKF